MSQTLSIQPKRSGSVKAELMTFLAVCLNNVMHDWLGWSYPISVAIAYTVVLTALYDSKRLKISFLQYFYRIAMCTSGIVLTFKYLPQELSKTLPISLAYALPVLAIGISFYWAPPLNDRKKLPLWQWGLGCVLAAGFFGWLAAEGHFSNL